MNIPISLQSPIRTPIYYGIEVAKKVPFLTDRPDDPVELCMKKIVVVYGLYKFSKIAIKIFIILPLLMVCAIGNLLFLSIKVMMGTCFSSYYSKNQFPKIEMLKDLIAILLLPVFALLSAFFDRLPLATRLSKYDKDVAIESAVHADSTGRSIYSKFYDIKDNLEKDRFQYIQNLFSHEELKLLLDYEYYNSELYFALSYEDLQRKKEDYQGLLHNLLVLLSLSSKKLKVDKKFYELVQDLIKQGIDYSQTNGLKWVVFSGNSLLLQSLANANLPLFKKALNTPDSNTHLTPVFALICDYFLNQNQENLDQAQKVLHTSELLFRYGADPNVIYNGDDTQLVHLRNLYSFKVIKSNITFTYSVFKTFVGYCIEYSSTLDLHCISKIPIDLKKNVDNAIAKGNHLPLHILDKQKIGLLWVSLIANHQNLLSIVIPNLIAQNSGKESEVKAVLSQAVRIAILLENTNAIRELQKWGAQLEYDVYLFLDQMFSWATSPVQAPLRIKPFSHSEYDTERRSVLTKSLNEVWNQPSVDQREEEIGVKTMHNVKILTNAEMQNAPSEIMIQGVSFKAIVKQIEWFIQTSIGSHHNIPELNKIIGTLKNTELCYLNEDQVAMINKIIQIFNRLLHFKTFTILPHNIQTANSVLNAFIDESRALPDFGFITQDTQKFLSDIKQIYDPIFVRIKQEIIRWIAPANINPLVDLIMAYTNRDHHVTVV